MTFSESKLRCFLDRRFPFLVRKSILGGTFKFSKGIENEHLMDQFGPGMKIYIPFTEDAIENREAKWTYVHGSHLKDMTTGYFFFENEADAIMFKLHFG